MKGTPWVVVVEGEAGIGKTALVRHSLAPGGDGLRVCWAGCDQAERDYPYGVVEQLLRQLQTDTPGLGDLVRSLTPAALSYAVGSDLLGVLSAATDAGPLALVVDDISWADSQSLATLSFVMRRLYTEPVLLVATARTGETAPGDGRSAPDWHEALARGPLHFQPVRLTGLDLSATGELATIGGAPELLPAAAERLLQHTGGHPLHLRSLLAQVTPAQMADMSRPLPVPASLDKVVSQSLDRLPDDARRLVESLAVLNTTVPLATVAQLAGIDNASHALGPALECGLVQWQSDQPTTPLRIHHQLQRDAVYQAITPTRRQALHAAAAALVSPGEAWAHKVAAAYSTDPDLADELAAEAEQQVTKSRYDRAATLELWAANLAPTRAHHEQRLLRAVQHLLVGHRHARAVALRSEVEGCAPTPQKFAVLGGLMYALGDSTSAQAHLSRAAKDATDGPARLMPLLTLGSVHIHEAQWQDAATALQRAVDLPLSRTALRDSAQALLTLSLGYLKGPRAALEARPLRLHDDPSRSKPGDCWALAIRGFMRGAAGELTAGTADLQAAAHLARAGTSLGPDAYFFTDLGWLQYLTGAWQEAAISAEVALDLAATNDQAFAYPDAHALAAWVCAGKGSWEEANRHEQLCKARAPQHPLHALAPILAGAFIAQAKDEPATMLDAMAGLTDAQALHPMFQLWYLPLYVMALISGSDLDRAQQQLDVLCELAERTPCLKVAASWLTGRLAAVRGDTQAALAALEAGVALKVGVDEIPSHRAQLSQELGRLLAAAGQPGAASRHLRTAHEMFTALGAVPYARRAAADLAAVGTQPSPDVTAAEALATLTDRERAVAQLAGRGCTNKEIAKELYISAKTVEYHLGHVYTKLGLTSRRSLRGLMPTA